jgi:hypothetical protein
LATGGLYGNTTSTINTSFTWTIYQASGSAPVTPIGGSWNFLTNTGVVPSGGWSSTPPAVPTTMVWVSVAFVSSQGGPFTWSAPAPWSGVGITTIPYPAAGIPLSTGTSWATGYTVSGTGNVLPTTAGPTISNAGLTGVPTAPTAAPLTNTTQIASTAFVTAAVGVAALPAQATNANKTITTDGTTASWAFNGTPTVSVQSGTSFVAGPGIHYVCTNVSAVTVTLPPSPASGTPVWVTFTNGLATNVLGRNASTIMALAEDMTIDLAQGLTVELRYVNSDWRLV